MAFTIIENPDFGAFSKRSGFRPHEFKRLAGLFSRAASVKAVVDMAVDVDFEEGVCKFSYYRTRHAPPFLTFVVRHVGPRTNMYELWAGPQGRICKSGLFSRVFERLEAEIEELIAPPG